MAETTQAPGASDRLAAFLRCTRRCVRWYPAPFAGELLRSCFAVGSRGSCTDLARGPRPLGDGKHLRVRPYNRILWQATISPPVAVASAFFDASRWPSISRPSPGGDPFAGLLLLSATVQSHSVTRAVPAFPRLAARSDPSTIKPWDITRRYADEHYGLQRSGGPGGP